MMKGRKNLPRLDLNKSEDMKNDDGQHIHRKLSNYPNANKLKFPNDPNEYQFNMENFKEEILINSDRHKVSEYLHEPSKRKVIIKFVPIPYCKNGSFRDKDAKFQQALKLFQEIDTHYKLSSCHFIVDFYGMCLNEMQALICMERMDKSLKTLYEEIHQSTDIFPEKLLGYISVAITNALAFLKENKAIHRDVKPENILINMSGDIKLCDFGESRFMEKSYAKTGAGTILYWPPERFICGSKYDDRSDVWSLGIVLIEAIYGKIPYFNENKMPKSIFEIQMIVQDAMANNKLHKIFTGKYSVSACEFITLCISELSERPYVENLQELTFYMKHHRVYKKRDIGEYLKIWLDGIFDFQLCDVRVEDPITGFHNIGEELDNVKQNSAPTDQRRITPENNVPHKILANKSENTLTHSYVPNDPYNHNPKYTFKLLIIGDSFVGKTTLFLRLSSDKFNTYNVITDGPDLTTYDIKIQGQDVKLHIWDTAGHERYTNILPPNFYRDTDGVIFVYDITNLASFNNLDTWMDRVRDNTSKNIAKVLVGNKTDLENERQVLYRKAKEYAKIHEIEYLEASAKSASNLEQIFITISKEIFFQRERIQSNHAPTTKSEVPFKLHNQKPKSNKKKCCD